MNLLIIGGLLVVAAASIIGAILLSIGEQRAGAKRIAGTQPGLQLPASVDRSESTPRGTTENTVISRSNQPAVAETPLPGRGEDQLQPSLNGQFRELAGEIRMLHQQAWQLEQRLSILTEMIDHIERIQNGRISIDEESQRPSQGADKPA